MNTLKFLLLYVSNIPINNHPIISVMSFANIASIVVLSSISLPLSEVKSEVIPNSYKLLLGTLAGLAKKIQQRMSRKVESSKWGFCLTGALERCTECIPAMTGMKVYFPLKKSDNLAIMHPESSNMLHVL